MGGVGGKGDAFVSHSVICLLLLCMHLYFIRTIRFNQSARGGAKDGWGRTLVSGEALASQVEIHAPWGGVVPNLAQEAHKVRRHARVRASMTRKNPQQKPTPEGQRYVVPRALPPSAVPQKNNFKRKKRYTCIVLVMRKYKVTKRKQKS